MSTATMKITIHGRAISQRMIMRSFLARLLNGNRGGRRAAPPVTEKPGGDQQEFIDSIGRAIAEAASGARRHHGRAAGP